MRRVWTMWPALMLTLVNCGSSSSGNAGVEDGGSEDTVVAQDGSITDSASPGADASDDALTGADADVVASVDCAQIVKDWAVFVASHAACSANADCLVVGGAYSCDLGGPIGQGSGDAISKSAKSDADALLNVFYGPACKAYRDGHGVSDAAPATNLRCASGQCQADSASCMVTADAEVDSATAEDGGADAEPDDAAADIVAPQLCTVPGTGTCSDSNLACQCCPAGGPMNHCLCAEACTSSADCHDPARPDCKIGPGTKSGFCAPTTFACCWTCL